ncbi:hypothetical protein DPEC_G00031000 [Dallia pectoralis]|uniref:Uncharacterized protein n=1 Tax=Dallia pectoralis TaxID=75939 RepID=A0ACC2HCS6_DALPE|nr:hypothetical protein DPEC_G00031000 [Dallia pectoralis]
MRTLSVIVMFALLGVLLANQVNEEEGGCLPQEDNMAQYDDSQEDEQAQSDNLMSQEDGKGQDDVAASIKLLQEIQNAPAGEKLQTLFWRRRWVVRNLFRRLYPYRWRSYYRCFWYWY